MTKNIRKWIYGLINAILDGALLPFASYKLAPESFNFKQGLFNLFFMIGLSVLFSIKNFMNKSPWEK
jgi:hypothetical protein